MQARSAWLYLESFLVISDSSDVVSLFSQFMRHHLVHQRGFWSHHGKAEHRLRSKIGMNSIRRVENLRIGWIQAAESIDESRGLVQIPRPGIQLDELHAGVDLDLLLFYPGKSLCQVGTRIDVVACALLGHAKKRLNFP